MSADTSRSQLSHDTIVARATGAGPSAIAVVRLTGPSSFDFAAALIRDGDLPEPGRVGVRWLVNPKTERVLDQVVVTTFAGPNSYTGEDVVELSCHGGPLTATSIIEACESLGARLAEPGEFTKRAYLNGRLDLIQAEAVGDLVEGESEALRQTALGQLERGLSRRLAELRAAIIHVEALLTHHLDFPDEDEPPVPLERVVDEAMSVAGALRHLVATAPEGELLREGVTTVFAGPPNAGKSSLFNALVGHDRAIVTEVPGTTRDAVEAKVQIGGFPFLLVDTAGLRASEDRVERIGIEVAERYLEEADLVIWCTPWGEPSGSSQVEKLGPSRATVVQVVTKVDLEPGSVTAVHGVDEGRDGPDNEKAAPAVRVSVETGEGLAELKALLPQLVFSGEAGARTDVPVITRARQRRGLETALAEVSAFAEALRAGVPAEVASSHLRPAATALEELLGVIPNDEVLDRVFRDFCIGK